MQSLRGTKDILPNEIIFWQHIYNVALEICSLYNYHEIKTPIIEFTSLFERSIGNGTDIVNKEMYSFIDQGNRNITLRPEGTASIARAFISNKLYSTNTMNKLWYIGPMFRYERPQSGRQRQFHQLGIECIGSLEPTADAEVIRIAIKILNSLQIHDYKLEINSIGDLKERNEYKYRLVKYLKKYESDLDEDSKNRLRNNPLRILDSKHSKTQEILIDAPSLEICLGNESKQHFKKLCGHLNSMNIPYNINNKLVRGLDYYNYTAFEIITKSNNNQDTVCGGGRYDSLIENLGGPHTPSVGWAIGIERLLLMAKNHLEIDLLKPNVYIATQGEKAKLYAWSIIDILEKAKITFELDLQNNSFHKQIRKANKIGVCICIIIGDNEILNNNVTIKLLKKNTQKTVHISQIVEEINKQ
uniref:Histidine--tRNA ligase, chloroplastic n=1 Tax=Pterocladia lucida TaxID=31408 RepID=A0A6M3WW47_PTELU|nr:syh [Pterocladia lucida]